MPPSFKSAGQVTAIGKAAIYNFPDPVNARESNLFMGKDDGNSSLLSAELCAEPLFLAAVEGAERLVQKEQVVRPSKGAGEVEAFEFSTAQAERLRGSGDIKAG